MSKLRPVGAIAAVTLLAACGGGDSPTPTQTPSPAATAPPGSPPQSFTYNVEPCFSQVVPGTGGRTMRDLIVPDALTFDLSRAADFPNGRDLDDQTVDITLAFLFLDLSESGQSLRTFANLPLNPPASDRAPIETFPYLAPPQGNPPLALTSGSSFNFRTDPDSAFVSVDRMGMPAIAPAIIGGPQRIPYNDAPQTADLQGAFRAEQTLQLTNLFNAIGDDLVNLGLEICATRS
ncbi:hypothetical protein [Qipengyuania sp. MTN3-11]|uniref:hypothetical protein n=1 Tax=Qipengyuania sp. MTN3-11 TaxID=3056557 RepID=UPI0036F1AC74